VSREQGEHGRLPAVYRLVAWLLPAHRKGWAEAMLNELAYFRSHRAAIQWALGCTFVAFRERVTYELEKTFMNRRIFKVLLGFCAALAVGTIGVYISAKPYQRDRIQITVHQVLHPEHSQHSD
jgi:beta-lactamase regulating signal transducer with metallopeptidase domain